MTSLPSLKRAVAAVLSVLFVGGVLFVFVGPHNTAPIETPAVAGQPKNGNDDWTMFGGTTEIGRAHV